MAVSKGDSTGPTPEEFLTALLEPAGEDAVAWCATMRRSQGDWTGSPCGRDDPPDCERRNAYYSIAAFPPDAGRRAKDLALGACVVLLDDVTTKGDYDGVLERLGEPSFKVRTSRDSQQWGYLLDEPASDEQIAPIHAALQRLGLCDRNGNSPVRYGRLPAGVNNKPEHGETFCVRCPYWKPKRRFRIAQLSAALGVSRSVAVRGTRDGGGESDRALERQIKTGESFHDPLTKLAFRRIMRGDRVDDVVWELQALMRKSQERDTQRWRDRYESIERTVHEVVEKFPEARVKQRLRREGKGFIADEENVGRVLETDETLHGLVRFDEFMCQRVITRAIPGDPCVVADREYPRPWRDEDTVALQRYVQDKYIVKVARDRVDAVLGQWSRSLWAFHPIKDYLNGLTWDRRSRIDGWLHAYMGANGGPHEYVRAIGAKWLIAAVARVMQPGCKVDTMLCLEGPQGIRKSMALRALAGAEHFSDSMPADLSSKDARDHLRGKWVVEMSELAQFRKSEIETVKAFLSRQVEMYRPAYGRSEVTYPRQCVFAGSTNASEYLVDDTGNRRFWVVACNDIDVKLIERDRDQLWAEAHARWWAGERWWLEGEVERIAAQQADARRLFDPWQDEIEAMLTTGNMKDLDRVKPGDVLANLDLTASQRSAIYAARVGKILKALGWRKPSRSSRVFGRPASRK